MTRVSLIKSLSKIRLTFLALVALSACADRAVVGPPMAVPSDATAAKGGTQGPTVKSTDPDSATVDSTLNVRVFGSGFDQGSRANWAFEGVVSEKIVTNSTVFVSSSELVANITIARNANIGSHDVIVTTSTGKPGIGTELFEVILKTTDLGTLGGTTSYAYNINNNGDITGQSQSSDGSLRATYWTRVSSSGWAINQLSASPGEVHSRAGEITDEGIVLGYTVYRVADGSSREGAVRWNSVSAAPEGFTGLDQAYVQGINPAEQVVGEMPVADSKHAFLWANGVITDLGGFRDGPSSAWSINRAGVIVGYGRATPLGTIRAVVWRMGVIAELPSLSSGMSFARDVNDDGVIVGDSRNSASELRAVRWVPTADEASGYRIEDLGIPKSVAQGINTSGEIVGHYRGKDGLNHAFFWHPTRGRMNLPALPRQKGAEAHGINDAGEVVGYGWTGTGQSISFHGIVWTGIR